MLVDLLKESGGESRYEPSEDSEDDDDEREEKDSSDEDDDEETRATTSVVPQASEEESVSLSEALKQLQEALSVDDVRKIGVDMLDSNEIRILERTDQPIAVFLRLVRTRHRGNTAALAAALRQLGKSELADLVAKSREK